MCPIVEKISKNIVRYYYTFACPNSKTRRKQMGAKGRLRKTNICSHTLVLTTVTTTINMAMDLLKLPCMS